MSALAVVSAMPIAETWLRSAAATIGRIAAALLLLQGEHVGDHGVDVLRGEVGRLHRAASLAALVFLVISTGLAIHS